MQPRQRGPVPDHVEGLVGSVVRANEQIGTRSAQLLSRRKEHLADFVPLASVDVTHVVGERIRVHGDFWMSVTTQKPRSLYTDCAVAQRRAFCAHGDDSYVLCH